MRPCARAGKGASTAALHSDARHAPTRLHPPGTLSPSRLRGPCRMKRCARGVLSGAAPRALSPCAIHGADRGIFSAWAGDPPPGRNPVSRCVSSRGTLSPRPPRSPPSCLGSLLPIAIRWMICTGHIPRRTPRSCLFKKSAMPSPRRQQPRYQGSLASCAFHPVRLRPSRSHPPCSSNLPQGFAGGASLGERRGRSPGAGYADSRHVPEAVRRAPGAESFPRRHRSKPAHPRPRSRNRPDDPHLTRIPSGANG
jgi:hypothetical protein